MNERALARLRTLRHPRHGARQDVDDLVVVEEPLEIRVHGETLAVTMRTPGHDSELALGLLFSEGVIESREDLGRVAHCGKPGEDGFGNTIDVTAAPGSVLDSERVALARRGTLTTASCGVCGRRSVDDLLERATPLEDESRFSRAVLEQVTERLAEAQPIFARTGGLHAAAAADGTGSLEHVREDVGRHNAVDKVIGRMLLDGALPARGKLLVVSGRTSFEIVQKALLAGFPVLVAVSAPTSLAVETARRGGLTLIGFCRDRSFNVYSGPQRVAD